MLNNLSGPRRVLYRDDEISDASAGMLFILEGWGCRTRALHDGRRQIFNLLMPGDAVGRLDMGANSRSDIGFLALTDVTVIDAKDVCDYPGVRAAILEMQEIERASYFDHMVRLGTHSAYERVADLLLEVHGRLCEIGLASDQRASFPVGQDRLGQLLGLSNVHVNRTFGRLKQEGQLQSGPGWFRLLRPAELAREVRYRSI